MRIIHCTRPARTGARFRQTISGADYWVSKRGLAWRSVRAPGNAGAVIERWNRCTLADVAADRQQFENEILADMLERSR
jgi:hypothetical protein